MKFEWLTEKSVGFLFGLGTLSHVVNFFLEELTLRNSGSFWVPLMLTSVLGFFYLVHHLELLKDGSYNELIGIKLRGYQLFLLSFVLFGSVIMFGGFLNTILLGSNYLFSQSPEQVEAFNILEVKSSRPGFKRRTKRRVPLLKISNEEWTDEVELQGMEFQNFNPNRKNIKIKYEKGLWGWGVIKEYIID